MQKWQQGFLGMIMGLMSGPMLAAQTSVTVFLLNDDRATKGVGEAIGNIEFEDSDAGLIIRPNLKGLPPGPHGFHIHEKDSCEGEEKNGQWEAGALAGGHFDPAQTGKHLGPRGKGHHGDLPVLNVNQEQEAKEKIMAPHLTVLDLRKRSVVIHENGDNYSDTPNPLGGGGARIACGVFS